MAFNACTGVTATWCPLCGDCTCPFHEPGQGPVDERTLDDPSCPLHGTDSDHGGVRALHPAGVPVEDEDDPGWPVACPQCHDEAFRLVAEPVLGSPTLGVLQIGRHGQVVAYSGALRCASCNARLDDPSSAPLAHVGEDAP